VTASVPSVEDLRRTAEAQGVTPSDADLERVRAFLAVLLPAFEDLERIVPPDAAP
jgi:hypothetical protein